MLLFVGGPEIILLVLLILIVTFIYKSFKSKNTSSRMMKKLLRYLVNTILFIVIWCIPAFIFVGISFSVSGTRPSAIAGVGGIVAIIISYRLVKRINKSKLWSSLFDETETVNDVALDKADIIEENQNKKANNISELSDDITKLGELKEKGLLTEEEFNEQKKKLLKQ